MKGGISGTTEKYIGGVAKDLESFVYKTRVIEGFIVLMRGI